MKPKRGDPLFEKATAGLTPSQKIEYAFTHGEWIDRAIEKAVREATATLVRTTRKKRRKTKVAARKKLPNNSVRRTPSKK